MRSEDSRGAPDVEAPVTVPKSEAVTRRLRSTPPPPPEASSPPIATVTVPALPPLERLDRPSRAKRRLVLAAVLSLGALSLVGARSLVHTQEATTVLPRETSPALSASADRASGTASASPAPPSAPVASAPPSDLNAAHASKTHKATRAKADDLF